MEYQAIAKRIVQVILTPEMLVGLAHGVASIPIDYGYLAYGYIDTENRSRNQGDTMRMMKAIKCGILENENLVESIKTVLDEFDKNASKETQDSIYAKTVGSIAGRMITNAYLSGKLANVILKTAVYSRLLAFRISTVSTILLTGGLATRSIYKSEELKDKNLPVYYALRHKGDLDFLYFLIQPFVDPFIDALSVRQKQGQEPFNKIVSLVEKELNGKKI
ncbi:hypothetical protein KGP17_08720 [Serratia sp. JSRIV001]|uniref:hypothetical protein n=1 Tax=Serratia sp. JSRIV001 TaxID=2831893 RepID=UPI001CC01730|nr:hypothetical protein [Serratia sp. JSRIV001]UAN47586.1 hypothetical protein KGP17_08720 [Serratia sp. JSRIV001]